MAAAALSAPRLTGPSRPHHPQASSLPAAHPSAKVCDFRRPDPPGDFSPVLFLVSGTQGSPNPSLSCIILARAGVPRGPREKAMEDGQRRQQIIDEMVRRIVERYDPEKIILFGSHARGTGGFDSDADLLVVMRVSGSKREAAVQIDLALAGVGMPKDVIVVTPEEVERYRDTVGTIIYPALREGKVLYERAA